MSAAQLGRLALTRHEAEVLLMWLDLHSLVARADRRARGETTLDRLQERGVGMLQEGHEGLWHEAEK